MHSLRQSGTGWGCFQDAETLHRRQDCRGQASNFLQTANRRQLETRVEVQLLMECLGGLIPITLMVTGRLGAIILILQPRVVYIMSKSLEGSSLGLYSKQFHIDFNIIYIRRIWPMSLLEKFLK